MLSTHAHTCAHRPGRHVPDLDWALATPTLPLVVNVPVKHTAVVVTNPTQQRQQERESE